MTLRSLSTIDNPIPQHARVVIIGGGVIGSSVAYHLSKLGVTDIVLLERAMMSSGTTWHAAGLIGQLRDTETETQLSGVYGRKLLQELENETGLSTGFKGCGSLTLASNKDRVTQLNIRLNKAKSFGIEGEIISPSEALKLYPYLNIDDLHAALWLPGDGTAISSDLTQALAKGARQRGVQIIERCKVTGISTSVHENVARVSSITTDRGTISCEVVVNCAGLWARKVWYSIIVTYSYYIY
jgi:4-methylaminobutanoate oxidase (formaldehyde-forming)